MGKNTYIIAAAVVFALMAAPAVAEDKLPAPTVRIGKKRHIPHDYGAACAHDAAAVLEIGGVRLHVARKDLGTVELKSGKILSHVHVNTHDFPCASTDLSGVKSVSMPDLVLSAAGKTFPQHGPFDRDGWWREFKKGTVKTEAGGIKKELAHEIYTLPQDAAPTWDKTPVILQCQPKGQGAITGQCHMAYARPDGLDVEWTFQRAEYAQDEFLEAYAAIQKRIDTMIKPKV